MAVSILAGELRSAAQAAFARRILPAMIGLLALALLAAALAVIHIAVRIDRDTLANHRFLADKALHAQYGWMSRSVVDYAFWGDAYAHLNNPVDIGWAYTQANFGPSLYRDFGYEAILVITPQGETSYAVVRGELAGIDAHQWLQGGLEQLVERARSALQDEQGAVGLLLAEGAPAIVAAAVLTAGESEVPRLDGPASMLVFVDILDPEQLLTLGRQFAIEGLRVASDTSPDSPAGLTLPLENGERIDLTWTPAQPGRYLLWMTLPMLALVAIGLGLLAWLLLRQALKTVQIMDASYARLANSRTALAASEERFRDVAEAASDWIWEADHSARLSYLSSRFEAITGHPIRDWLGRPLLDLLISDKAALQDWLANPQDGPLRCSYRAVDGCERHCRLSARAISRDGVLLGYRGTASDITDEARAQARIHHLSQHDALTSLPNRHRMSEYLESRIAALSGGAATLAVLYIDLDRFKPVNDTFGHGAGDEVLMEVSSRLKKCTRDDDMVARLGGDEFVMVVGRIRSNEEIGRLCARIIASLGRPFRYENKPITIGASIGIAVAPTDARHTNELLRCADIALYQAKADGRGTWRFYNDDMDTRLNERHRQEGELRNAIDERQFVMHYQPRYLGDSLRFNGAEALPHWEHPQRGLLPPEQFMPLAEETGLVIALGNWAIRQACMDARRWSNEAVVSINVSALQLRDSQLHDEIAAALHDSGLPASRLELELTEGALLQESPDTLGMLNKLKAMGLRLSMDHFGTGYSSLSNLRKYPFDAIKIDRSFVAGIPQSTEDHCVVQALIGLGHGLRMQVTAEGVETAEQLQLLLAAGCSQVQGLHMSHPLPSQALTALMEQDVETSGLV